MAIEYWDITYALDCYWECDIRRVLPECRDSG